jgi:hypothetical protein
MTREEEQRLEMRLDAIVDEITALLGGDEDRALQTILRAAATGFDPRRPDECLVMLVREHRDQQADFGAVTI